MININIYIIRNLKEMQDIKRNAFVMYVTIKIDTSLITLRLIKIMGGQHSYARIVSYYLTTLHQ